MIKAQAARKKALLAKNVIFRNELMTKAALLQKAKSEGARVERETKLKHSFNRTHFNRLEGAAQRAYEEKMKIRMPYALVFPDGVFFEITKTEAEFFASLEHEKGEEP